MVEGLLLFVIAAQDADAAHLTQRIEFIDKNDAGRGLSGLFEQVMHASGADTDEHLDELRPRDGKEGHAGLSSDGFGNQGLAGARRTDQQCTFGDVCPRREYFALSLRKETISTSSTLASSMPATSAKVTPVSRSTNTLARDLPMFIKPPMPCFSASPRNRKYQITMISTKGSNPPSSPQEGVFVGACEPDTRVGKVRRQRRLHPHGRELGVAVDGLLQLAADLVFLDP